MDINEASFWWLASTMAWHGLMLLGPFFIALAVAAIIGNLVQTGIIFSLDPVKMDWNRLDPVQGFKKMFAPRKLFDATKICLKLALLTLIVYQALKHLADQFFAFGRLSPIVLLKTVVADIASIGFKMALVLAILAGADFIYTRREFAKKMRMSRRDIKDESKNRDGDPRIRSRLLQLRHEMFKRSASTRNTRDADVLIVNPIHFAVALKYVHGEMESPRMLAKGSGAFAAAMRAIAAKHHIPVVQNVTLARKLFREMEIDQHVPANMYADVARIIVWVFAMRRAANGATGHGGAV